MQNYLIKNEASNELTLRVHGEIDELGAYFGGTSAEMVIAEIEEAQPKSIKVSINSGGGSVFEGLTIYNYLKDFKGSVKVEIDGLAASMASVIAQAGTTVTMKEGSLMMVHDPLTVAMGNADEMRKVADMLDKVGGSLADIYVSNNKKGKSKEEILSLMNATTWMDAKEAVEMGFASRYKEGKKNVSNESIMKLAARYNPPKEVLNNLNNNKVDSKSFKEQLRDFFGLSHKEEVEEIKNEITEPVKAEYEAKLQAEQEAKAQLEAEKQDLLNKKAEELAALQAKNEELEAKIKNNGAPVVAVSDDKGTSDDEQVVMTEKQKLEASLLGGFSDSKKKEYEAVQARAQKIAQYKNKK